MRALPFALASSCVLAGAAGCLSAPTGRDPAAIDAAVDGAGAAWPPPSANIVAITAGDLDGDGKDDLIAADAANARVFLLRGGVDLDPTRTAVTSTSDSAPLAGLRAPAAAIIARNGGARFVVVLDNPASGPRLTVLDAQLVITSQTSAGQTPAPSGAVVSLTQTTFGMNMNAIFGSIPDAVFFMEGTVLGMATPAVMQLPENGATPLASVIAVAGFVASGTPASPTVVVSELDHAQKAIASGPGVFNWSTVRATGPTWTAQTPADITGDTYADIVAFAPEGGNTADLCVLDAQAGTTACLDTPFGMDTAAIAVGPVVAPNQSDVVLAHVNPGNPSLTAVFVVPRLRVQGTLLADGMSAPTMLPAMNGLLALAQLDGAGKEILVVGQDGAIVCARSNGGAPVACAP
ncbi:MAG TPA: hypothetical protein VM261_17525 [Kofleriaceae bacterium]|nr:hypothetical protein [Kofleriaceae bacterium]